MLRESPSVQKKERTRSVQPTNESETIQHHSNTRVQDGMEREAYRYVFKGEEGEGKEEGIRKLILN
jgi:hypothetical protein